MPSVQLGAFFMPLKIERSGHLNVLVVEPGMVPYEKEINGLEEMQAVVGGTISAIYPYEEPVAVVCNDDAIYLNLPFNRSVEGGLRRRVRYFLYLRTHRG